MRKILNFIKLDAKHVFANVISLVVCVGMVVVPSFYAWFNIAGSWDPYGNTKNLKVAVANCDAGYTGELLPIELNMGQRMEASLRESTSIGYTFVSEDEAVEGVRSGEYYAAIVFPESFTTDMLSVLSDSAKKPQVLFYQNEKANAIASIVTNKASTAVQQDIDSSFAESVTSVGAGVLEDLTDYLDDDGFSEFAIKLSRALDGAAESLGDAGDRVTSFGETLSTVRSALEDAGSTSTTSLSSTLDVGNGLRDTASNVRSVGDSLSGATDAVNTAIQSSASSLDGVRSSLQKAFDGAGKQTEKLASALEEVKGSVDENAAKLGEVNEKLEGVRTAEQSAKDAIDPQVDSVKAKIDAAEDGWNSIEPGLVASRAKYRVLFKASNALQDSIATITELQNTISSHIQSLNDLSSHLSSTASDLRDGKKTVEEAKSELEGLIDSAKSSISDVQGQFESDVKSSLSGLASTIDGCANSADTIKGAIQSALDSVSGAASDAASSVASAQEGLSKAGSKLSDSATDISYLTSRLSSALNSGDMDEVRTILSSGASSLASFISSPVEMDRNAVYATENNGSAMTPFYTTLAIWIGGVVLAALVKCNPSEKRIEETGCRPHQSYLGRIAFFVAVGFMQTLLIMGGDLFYLGVQCAHPWLFVLAGLTASLVFVNIIYALTASFGDVGKAIAVVLMVIQVAGSGGTFPVQMLPEGFFQTVYPFLPFVHAENAMRAAMFGIYNGDFWAELATLLVYLVPALLLGLVLRTPVIRLNEWVEERLESTKIM
ncbi:YhgE/Pip domain-containing protein [Paratractidigestivibacter sp.]|uniref:YhgE/Pip domain-containing protein n=1 Tax=Paratractidigestivibacter sp. TaxID=2847316 RepID=UPI002AC8B60C|nr:YhgE/Pip domain-containing protein [Paratractidigestivibacter sp.]